MKIYLSLSKTCAVCDRGVETSQHVGLYVVGDAGALAYTMCAPCGERFRRGLSRHELIALDTKMERAAEQLGLAIKH